MGPGPDPTTMDDDAVYRFALFVAKMIQFAAEHWIWTTLLLTSVFAALIFSLYKSDKTES